MQGFEHRNSDIEIDLYEMLNLWSNLDCYLNMSVGYIYFVVFRMVLVSFRRLGKLRKAIISFVMSVCLSVRMEQFGSHWTDFHEMLYLGIFENLARKFKFHENLTRMTGILHEDKNTYLSISRSVFRRMRNGSDESCRENQNTHFVFNQFLNCKIVPFMR
jgi:hypothetical protein